jgi:hypothetical protein
MRATASLPHATQREGTPPSRCQYNHHENTDQVACGLRLLQVRVQVLWLSLCLCSAAQGALDTQRGLQVPMSALRLLAAGTRTRCGILGAPPRRPPGPPEDPLRASPLLLSAIAIAIRFLDYQVIQTRRPPSKWFIRVPAPDVLARWLSAEWRYVKSRSAGAQWELSGQGARQSGAKRAAAWPPPPALPVRSGWFPPIGEAQSEHGTIFLPRHASSFDNSVQVWSRAICLECGLTKGRRSCDDRE